MHSKQLQHSELTEGHRHKKHRVTTIPCNVDAHATKSIREGAIKGI